MLWRKFISFIDKLAGIKRTKMKKKEIELERVKGLRRLKDFFKEEINKRSDTLNISNETLTTIKIEDYDKDSTFSFELKESLKESGKPFYVIEYNPMNSRVLDPIQEKLEENKVKESFIQWVNIVDEYNKINLDPDDQILNAYVEEFYVEYEIIDDDSSVKPFNLEQQQFLDNFLESVQKTLNKHTDDDEIQTLIEETTEIRENLTRETKKRIINRISRLVSKIRIKGLKLLGEIINEAKKELIKRIITGSLDGIENIL